ncbi:hypothetical protein [Winogradskyella ouciana]|uniref:hypothetical protein n=1 Tax=Winogradskyella ouciana TaxID=2608631 RepID=UPI003D2D0792
MKNILKFTIIFFITLGFTSCSLDDDGNVIGPTGNSKTYALVSVDDPNIFGTARFIENSNNSTTVELELVGTPSGGMHPAHIHFNTAAEGGDIAVTLGTVDGSTGFSTVIVSELDDGNPITYDQLINFDGYINVHLSASDLGTLVAQGDIGENELTGESKVYALDSVDDPAISGTATFQERVNGESLATIDLENTTDGAMHPAHIHANTAAEGGDIVFTFNSIDGTTGMSKTNVDAIAYVDILDYDGYINVHLSSSDLGTLVAQGDIGQNELTGESKVYVLNSVDVPTASGTATFEERVNGEALATLDIINSVDGEMHPAHIHAGSVATAPGAILFTFNSVDGTTGVSKTNVSALDDDTAFGYDDVLTVDGYINVHFNAANLATLVAQGDIGINE